MNPLHDFERRIDKLMRDVFGEKRAPAQGRELIEVQRAILELIGERVQMLPRARRAFPYNDVVVRIPVPDEESRTAAEMVFVQDDALGHQIRDWLRREEVEFPDDLRVRVALLETQEVTDPSLVCSKREADAPAAPAQVAAVRFTPAGGEPVEVVKERIHIGRCTEVLDDRRRLVRRNDVAIDESTVSRAHAHIEFAAGTYRLFDDGSSYGTAVIHGGRLVDVPKAGARGQRLASGDEIYFGQARVRFELLG
jgi:hypothetical protein